MSVYITSARQQRMYVGYFGFIYVLLEEVEMRHQYLFQCSYFFQKYQTIPLGPDLRLERRPKSSFDLRMEKIANAGLAKPHTVTI